MGNYEYAYIIEAARLVTNIEAAITSAIFDISDHSARHENGGVDVLSLAGLAVAIGDVTGHDKALHDGLSINADQVDGEEAAAIVTDARVKAHFPDTIGNILSDHDKAAHDALGIAPASHGADKHTNRTRKLFISAGLGYGTGGLQDDGIYPIVTLDADADEYWHFSFIIPEDYNSGGTIRIIYSDAGLLPNDVVWDAYLWHSIDGELETSNASTDTTNTLAIGEDTKTESVLTSLALTNPVVGEYVGVKINRDANHGSDNYALDWQIIGLIFEYTADQ